MIIVDINKILLFYINLFFISDFTNLFNLNRSINIIIEFLQLLSYRQSNENKNKLWIVIFYLRG